MRFDKAAPFALLLVACWPVVVWYGRGSFDGSNEPWGLFALATAALLLWRGPPEFLPKAPPSRPFALPAACLLLYSLATLAALPVSLRAIMATLTLAVVVAANAIRAAALFYLETGLLPLPAWTHEAAGMSVFVAAGLLIVHGLVRIDRMPNGGETCSPSRAISC